MSWNTGQFCEFLNSDQLHLGTTKVPVFKWGPVMEWCEISHCAVPPDSEQTALMCWDLKPESLCSTFPQSFHYSWYFSNIAWWFCCSFQHDFSCQCFLFCDAKAATFCHSWLRMKYFLITISHCLELFDFMGPQVYSLPCYWLLWTSRVAKAHVRDKTCLSCYEQVDYLQQQFASASNFLLRNETS